MRKTRESGEEWPARIWLFAILFAFLLCARFPRSLLHAELWGDDGWTFYPDAYNAGVRCLLWPVSGYLNTVQRVGALLAVWMHVPFLWLPTVFAAMGLSVQLAVVLFLISSRLQLLWQSWHARAAFAALYIFLPNTIETFGTLTNSQWHLGILAFLIVVSPPGATAAWRLFDLTVLIVSSVSGPFCLLLVLFSFVTLWKYRSQIHSRVELVTRSAPLCAGALVQATFLLHGHGVRSATLGATPLLLTRIIAFRLVMGLLFGLHAIVRIGRMGWWQAWWPPVVITLAAGVVVVVAFRRGGYLFRISSVFAAMLFAIELASPVVSGGMDQWQGLATPFPGQRYFLVPMLVLLGALFVLAAQQSRLERWVARASILIILCVGVPLDSFQTHMQPTDYDVKARALDAAPPGTRAELPVHPYGTRDMAIVKKAY